MKGIRKLIWILVTIGFVWFLLTLYVQQARKDYVTFQGDTSAAYTAVILFNPDPFYNLDEQVALRFGEALAAMDWKARILSVAALERGEPADGDLYILIANTYNWSPDKPIQRTIQSGDLIRDKPVIAVTLGSGSTKRSQRLLEALIQMQGGKLIGSETYWLLRPNDETIADRSNTEIALDKVSARAVEFAQLYENSFKNSYGDVE